MCGFQTLIVSQCRFGFFLCQQLVLAFYGFFGFRDKGLRRTHLFSTHTQFQHFRFCPTRSGYCAIQLERPPWGCRDSCVWLTPQSNSQFSGASRYESSRSFPNSRCRVCTHVGITGNFENEENWTIFLLTLYTDFKINHVLFHSLMTRMLDEKSYFHHKSMIMRPFYSRLWRCLTLSGHPVTYQRCQMNPIKSHSKVKTPCPRWVQSSAAEELRHPVADQGPEWNPWVVPYISLFRRTRQQTTRPTPVVALHILGEHVKRLSINRCVFPQASSPFPFFFAFSPPCPLSPDLLRG